MVIIKSSRQVRGRAYCCDAITGRYILCRNDKGSPCVDLTNSLLVCFHPTPSLLLPSMQQQMPLPSCIGSKDIPECIGGGRI